MNKLLSKEKKRPDSLFLIIAAVLIIVTAVVYSQVRSFEFLSFDDDEYVTKNPNIPLGLSAKGIEWAFTFYAGNWHPLTWLSHLLDYELFGMNPAAPHIINVLLHIANAVLLFWLFLRMTKLLWPSAFIAALFALHPLHIESVAWVAERKDVLSTFFWFLTMLAYFRYTESKTTSRYAMLILAFILGLMAKPMLVTLPFALLLIDYWPLNRLNKNSILEKLPLFAISACSSVVTFFAQKSGGAVSNTQIFPIPLRFENAIVSYSLYLGKMFWPVRLAVFYPHSAIIPFRQIAVAAVIFFVITILVLRFRRLKWPVFGWLWYLGTLVPVIGLVQVGSQAMADRYTYIPLIGIFVILGWAASELLPRLPYRNLILASSAIAILSALAVRTYSQLGHWRNSFTLYTHSLSVTPDNPMLRYNLAVYYGEKDDTKQALEQFLRCYKMEPLKPDTNYNLGFLYDKQGDTEKALKYYLQTVKIKPDYIEAHNNLAVLLIRLDRIDEAIEHFQEIVRLRPDDPSVTRNLETAITLKKIYRQADQLYDKAAAFDKEGNFKDAALYYRKALEQRPNFAAAAGNLAWIQATCSDSNLKNPAEAVNLAETACRLTHYKNPRLLDILAAAQAAKGNFLEAVLTAQKAVFFARQQDQTALAEKILERIELYEKRQPFLQSK